MGTELNNEANLAPEQHDNTLDRGHQDEISADNYYQVQAVDRLGSTTRISVMLGTHAAQIAEGRPASASTTPARTGTGVTKLTNTQLLARWKSLALKIFITLETFTRKNAVVGILTKPVHLKVFRGLRRKNDEDNKASSMQIIKPP